MITHLSRKQLAEREGVAVRTVERWWIDGTGPRGLRVGLRRIVYPLAEVEAWEGQRLYVSRQAKLSKALA